MNTSGPHSHGTAEPVSEHQPGKTGAHRDAYANPATDLDATMLDLLGMGRVRYRCKDCGWLGRWTKDHSLATQRAMEHEQQCTNSETNEAHR